MVKGKKKRNVSLTHSISHMEATPDVQGDIKGMDGWTTRT